MTSATEIRICNGWTHRFTANNTFASERANAATAIAFVVSIAANSNTEAHQ